MQYLLEVKSIEQHSRKRRNNHNKIVLLPKTKLNTIRVLISKGSINSCVSHDKFGSVNNVLREYKEIKEKKIRKMLWSILYKNSGNLLCQLLKIHCERKFLINERTSLTSIQQFLFSFLRKTVFVLINFGMISLK